MRWDTEWRPDMQEFRRTFTQSDDAPAFDALSEAECFLQDAGFSVGPISRGDPVAAMFGSWSIAKWRNLTAEQQAATHALIEGNRRTGPVTVVTQIGCPPAGIAALVALEAALMGEAE